MKQTSRFVQFLRQPLVQRCRQKVRALVAPAGVAAYVLATLMTASAAARADDLDIYTKATAIVSGAPALALILDTSAQMQNDMIKNPAQAATTLLHQRSYTMGEALRSVITSAPANTNISITNYANNGTYDKGRIMQEQVTVGNTASTAPGVTYSGTVNAQISKGIDDAAQLVTSGSPLRLGDNNVSMPVQESIFTWPPTISSVTGNWTSSGGAGLTASCVTCTTANISNNTYWQNPWSYGNKYYYYYQSSTTNLTQTFTLDSTQATTDTVLFVVDYYGTASGTYELVGYNDNRSNTPTCNTGDVLTTVSGVQQCQHAGTTTTTTPSGSGKSLTCPSGYTLSGSGKNAICTYTSPTTYYTPTTVVNNNSTVTVTLPSANKWYIIVAATFSPGKADNFTLATTVPGIGGLYDPWAWSGQYQTAGFYFRNIQIPQGASITSAKLVFTNLNGSGGMAPVVAGYDTQTNPPDFSVQDINSRSMSFGSLKLLDTSAANPSLDVTNRVNQAVGQSGWCPGQAVALFVKDGSSGGSSNYLIAQSYEGNPAQAAQLQITYDPASGNPSACSTKNVVMPIGSMSDDTNQFADGTMDVATAYMPATASNATLFEQRAKLWISNTTKVGLRFPLAPIPTGAHVLSAKLRLTARGTTSAQPMSVFGILSTSGNAQAFLADNNYLDTLTLTPAVSWTPANWLDGSTYDSPDLTSIVQAQVNQGNWVNENTIGFVIKGSAASVMKACAWEYKPSGDFAPNVAGVLTPADFGSCAAQLIMTIDYGGSPVQTTNRRVLVNDLTYPNLPMTGNQPMGAAYLKTAEYLAGYFNYFPGDGIPDQGSCDTASPVKPQLSSGSCASNTVVLIGDNNEAAAYDKTGYTTELSTFVSAVAPGTSGSCTISGSGSNMSGKNCTTTVAGMLFSGFKQVGSGSTSIAKTYPINFGPTAGGAGGGGTTTGGGTMRGIATAGGGVFQQAAGAADLVKELLAIIVAISDQGAAVASPGVSVNALNRFTHLDQLYYSLFKPSTKVDWTGNMKRYQLLNNTVSDVYGQPAVLTSANSFFSDTARSWWSHDVDGAVVTDGGAATATLEPARQIYTYLGNLSAASATTLTDQVTLANNNIDEFVLGLNRLPYYLVPGGALANQTMVNARRNDVINWLRATPLSDPTILWAASIHGSPRIVEYNTATQPTISVFYGDNRGFLHAIDAGQLTDPSSSVNLANTGGTELFSFVPADLIRNSGLLNDNTQDVLVGGYIYGMDGPISLYSQDTNFDGNLDSVLLYMGERRGGRNYYALDVTNARADVSAASRVPKLQFAIQGGTGSYAELGQTWSAMSPKPIMWNGTSRQVLFFTGGYDAALHDNGLPFQNTNQLGRMVYIVDAVTGQLLWRSGDLSTGTFPAMASMKYSMTAVPRLIDRDADGNIDGMYVVDLAGQIFRFDFNTVNTGATNLVKNVVLVAQLGATATGASPTADNRRFYDAPSVAYQANASGGLDVMLAVSSGYREMPTDATTKEAFFFVRDVNAYNRNPQVNPTITLSSLVNITGLTQTNDTTKPGWYFYFNQSVAEKGIGSPVIFNGAVLFDSFVMSTSTNMCIPNIGNTYLYLVDFLGNGLVINAAGTTSRWQDIGLPGLGDTPQILFNPSGGLDVAVGVKVMTGDSGNNVGDSSVCGAGSTNCKISPAAFGTMRKSRWYVEDQQ